jgi:ParB family chromosome partitioning protein
MIRLAESVRLYGVREPGVARPRTEGGFELLCGNRRKRACELVGLVDMPVIIREMDDSHAVLVIVGSNLDRREKILPSERAWAYRMMMESLNHNGVKGNAHSCEIIAERTGMKKSQIFRFIRLTELIITLLDKVDSGQLAFNPAVELSHLSVKEQTAVAEAMSKYVVKPSCSQAIRLKTLSQDGTLTAEAIDGILAETKNPSMSVPTGTVPYREFFPPDTPQSRIDAVIIDLLTRWKARSGGQTT